MSKTGRLTLGERLAESPAWRARLASHGFSPYDLSVQEGAFGKWPRLSREDLAQNALDWISASALELETLDWVWSSGSREAPFAVPLTLSDKAFRWRIYQRAASERGVDAGALVRGALLCALPGRPEYQTFQDAEQRVPVERISIGREGWPSRLRDAQPTHWNVSPIGLELLLHAHRQSKLPPPQVIFSTALQLSSALRWEAQEVFGCPVIDLFSSVETGPFAVGCIQSQDDGVFHVRTPDFVVEVACGVLRITRLTDAPLPLLNYELNDTAERLEASCPLCGQDTPTLTGLRGRTRSQKGEHRAQ